MLGSAAGTGRVTRYNTALAKPYLQGQCWITQPLYGACLGRAKDGFSLAWSPDRDLNPTVSPFAATVDSDYRRCWRGVG